MGLDDAASRRITAMGAVIALVTLSACTAGPTSPSSSPAASAAETPPEASATPIAAPSTTPVPASPSPTASAAVPVASSDATFNILPAPEPAGFVPDITCSGPIGTSDPVALVQLHDATVQAIPEVVLRDYADPADPRTVCRFASTTSGVVQLIDARHVVIVVDYRSYAVVDLPEVRYHWFQLPTLPDTVNTSFVAVSPALDEVLWTSTHGDPPSIGTHDVHVTTSTGDQVVASIPVPLGGRCGSPEDSKVGAYAHSGSHAFVLDQVIPSNNSLVAIEGTATALSVLPPTDSGTWSGDGFPAMATWSPGSATLFYRQGSDVWRWTPGSDPEVFLPGVKWYYPTFSPDGGHLAYAIERADRLHDVYLVDLAQDESPRLIGEARNRPVFINDQQLWYLSEGEGMCGPSGDKPLIYSLTDGSEAPSVIDRVIGTWPATGSNQ